MEIIFSSEELVRKSKNEKNSEKIFKKFFISFFSNKICQYFKKKFLISGDDIPRYVWVKSVVMKILLKMKNVFEKKKKEKNT